MRYSPNVLLELFARKTVVDLPTIREALGGVSAMTAFRYLRQVSYRRSYNHNGRYYCLYDPSRCDRLGLWSIGDVHFSKDGSLKATVRRMVHEAPAGMTHRELADILRVRVHNTLLGLVREGEVTRERFDGVYVYLHSDAAIREEQIKGRRERLSQPEPLVDVDNDVIIQVLLVLVRYPGSSPGDVARRLQKRSPPVRRAQVESVFARYGLGEKGGPRMY